MGLGALVLVVLVVLLIRGMMGGGSCDDPYCATDAAPESPEGFERVSKVFEINPDALPAEAGQQLDITLTLSSEPEDDRNLSFYAWDAESDEWTSLATASLNDDRESARAVVSGRPAAIAVLHRDAPAGEVVAMLPDPAIEMDPRAAALATVAMSYDLMPTGDGAVNGTIRAFPDDRSYRVMPVIYANRENSSGAAASVINILDTPSLRSGHVNAIVEAVTAAGADGVTIDYSGLGAELRTPFLLFTVELGQRLRSEGLSLALVLDPPAREDGQFQEGAYDWTELSKIADFIVMRPYLDQRDFRVVVPDILAYLGERMDTGRLVLGLTPYSTRISGSEPPQRISLYEAMQIATQIQVEGAGTAPIVTESRYRIVGVNIDRQAGLTGPTWDPSSATVAFSYQNPGDASGSTIYIENALSAAFKAEYVPRFELGGIAVDDASVNPQIGTIWQGLESFVLTGQPALAAANTSILAPRWSLEQGGGTLDNDARGSVLWTAPTTAGEYTISLTLSDGVDFFENRMTIRVDQRSDTALSP